MSKPVLRTTICEMFGIEYPIFLAGMGPFAKPDLVAAVSNAGGLGVLGRSTPHLRQLYPEELRGEIRRVRELTDKPFGVDLILPSGMPQTGEGVIESIPQEHRDFIAKLKVELGVPELPAENPPPPILSFEYNKRMMEVICEERVPVFASGLGLADWVVPMCREAGIKIISLVGNVKNARRVVKTGAEVVGAQGYDAGGHTGRVGTFSLIPQVVDAVAPIPVLAAGGIADGRGLAAALALGAAGVWCGTAFLATKESPIAEGWKQRIVEMTEEDTRISRSWTGKTARFIRNRWIDLWEEAPVPYLPMPYQGALVRDFSRAAHITGDTEYLSMATGQIGGLVREIKPAGDVLRAMVAEAVEILSNREARAQIRN